MKKEDAEEFTQSLGQIMSGSWRQIALAERLEVPKALGFASTKDWVQDRLGGYVRMSIDERREAVVELAADGASQREIAGVLGVGQATVHRDLSDSFESDEPDELAFSQAHLGEDDSFESPEETQAADQPRNPTYTKRKAGEDARKAILEAPADPEILPGVYVEDFSTGSDRAALP